MSPARGTLLHIFIAPKRGAAMQAPATAVATPGSGLVGDRYADARHRRGPENELTLIQQEHIDGFVAALGKPLPPDAPRRNLVTRGIDLGALIGARFTIGAVLLEGIEPCEPCRRWARRTYPEVIAYFAGRGGLNARVLGGGTLAIGDVVQALSAPR